ncbi:unnamed protein product [Ilex paraguariensis]|uniref:Telomeric single stranded DNA binding POT1/Cdc13 domain-containing protein n=1 Tax=Ilex paraguariensis TaxID=185542 RepID=A0ABC8S9S7_9AQUA
MKSAFCFLPCPLAPEDKTVMLRMEKSIFVINVDCFCTIKVIDESRPSPGISVNIFAENMEKLPHVDSTGDIIQLAYVVVY